MGVRVNADGLITVFSGILIISCLQMKSGYIRYKLVSLSIFGYLSLQDLHAIRNSTFSCTARSL